MITKNVKVVWVDSTDLVDKVLENYLLVEEVKLEHLNTDKEELRTAEVIIYTDRFGNNSVLKSRY